KEKRWSGFRDAGVQSLKSESVIVLRSGDKGGPTVADAVLFEEVPDAAAKTASPNVRAPASHRANEELFDTTEAKFVRFTISATNSGEPCIDEIEVFAGGKNIALTSAGTTATASGVFGGGQNEKHQLAHINDGLYGNSH